MKNNRYKIIKYVIALALPFWGLGGFTYAEEEPADTAVWNRDPLGLETVVVTATRTPKALKDIPVVTRVIMA